MAGIDKYLDIIKKGVFGRDVRKAIHDGIEQVYEDATFDGNTNMEVAKARGNANTLSDRLQGIDGDLANSFSDIQKNNSRIDNLIANAGNGSVPSELTDIRIGADGNTYVSAGQAIRNQFTNALTGEIQISSVEDLVPPYNDLDTLPVNSIVLYAFYKKVAHKPDNDYIGGANVQTVNYHGKSKLGATQILTQSDGTMFNRVFWRKNEVDQWTDWQIISRDNSIVSGDKQIIDKEDLVPPYNDLNTLKPNTILTYAHYGEVENKPDNSYMGGATVMTISYSKNSFPGMFQILIQKDGTMYHRIYWYITGKNQWSDWKKSLTEEDVVAMREPFQPSIALFEKIGVIGDSYSSGEIYPDGHRIDKYSISWGQVLARKNGVSCTNFSRGGLTTRSWLSEPIGLEKLNASEPQNLYYISLGINDKDKLGTSYIGTEVDIENGSDTFYGNYAKIIKAVQFKAPHAKIILIDSAWSSGDTDPFYIATKNIAAHFGLPLLKHQDDPFLASAQFKNDLMDKGHPVAISYAAMATSFEKLTLQALRDNINYFKDYRG
jgi:hypothetical protein